VIRYLLNDSNMCSLYVVIFLCYNYNNAGQVQCLSRSYNYAVPLRPFSKNLANDKSRIVANTVVNSYGDKLHS
jgi:hypothetical protein